MSRQSKLAALVELQLLLCQAGSSRLSKEQTSRLDTLLRVNAGQLCGSLRHPAVGGLSLPALRSLLGERARVAHCLLALVRVSQAKIARGVAQVLSAHVAEWFDGWYDAVVASLRDSVALLTALGDLAAEWREEVCGQAVREQTVLWQVASLFHQEWLFATTAQVTELVGLFRQAWQWPPVARPPSAELRLLLCCQLAALASALPWDTLVAHLALAAESDEEAVAAMRQAEEMHIVYGEGGAQEEEWVAALDGVEWHASVERELRGVVTALRMLFATFSDLCSQARPDSAVEEPSEWTLARLVAPLSTLKWLLQEVGAQCVPALRSRVQCTVKSVLDAMQLSSPWRAALPAYQGTLVDELGLLCLTDQAELCAEVWADQHITYGRLDAWNRVFVELSECIPPLLSFLCLCPAS